MKETLKIFRDKLNNNEFVYGPFMKTSDPMFVEAVGLAGIRVGNNGKRPAAVDLFCIIITHYYSPPNISLISLKIYFRSSSGSAIYDGSAFKTELPSNSGWIPK